VEQSILIWLQDWCTKQCNGEWEHDTGVQIHTVDNPGWWIGIDLEGTEAEAIAYVHPLVETSETNWYFYGFANAKFTASGDLTKLEFLLRKFREIIENFHREQNFSTSL